MVTQDLTKLIKNLTKEIRDVPLSTSKDMGEIPSALMQTKNKQFFKDHPKTEEPAKKTDSPKSGTNSEKNSKNSVVTAKTSVTSNKTLSKSSLSSTRKNSSFYNVHPLVRLKEEVQKAIRSHRTFTVQGRYNAIRNALHNRGWVEKFHPSYYNQLREDMKIYRNYTITELIELTKRDDLATLCKNLIKSKLLANYQVDFYWGTNNSAFNENPDKCKLTIINKLKRDIFSYTNKQGLCDASKYAHWYQKPNVSKLNHPRSYSLSENGENKDFVDDFRKTAAMSLLKWIMKTSATGQSKLISPTGKIPLEVFEFAVNECCKFIKKQTHEDIDTTIPNATDREWNTFLDYFYKIVHYCNHFTEENQISEESLVNKAKYVINKLRETWPWIDMDGMMNIWILKPVASSRGMGIHMCRTLDYALRVIKNNSKRKYIIQKYIERPLLIHNTKFDIRQWFLISNCSPLTIWMYKECYLRFSSQTYNLRKLHESIHLTNNSVQVKYKNNSLDAALPTYNMWDSNEFKKYLANIGYPNVFQKIIYPGMKQCITAAVLMHQEKMIVRKNCFELYGADFIITEDFQPWLLEINSNPALYASTPVTARMGPKVLEDVIKVIIDYARNMKANTGEFEMIYKEKILELPQPASLEVKGVPLRKEYFNPAPDEGKLVVANKQLLPNSNQNQLKCFTDEIKKTLTNMLKLIHDEKLKRDVRSTKNDLKIK